MKKTFVCLAAALFLMTLTPVASADGNPWIPPGKMASSLR